MKTQQKQFKTFDPNPSLRFALSILSAANVTRYALIGRLAMWVYIEDESQHKYTKDVDFAIILEDAEKVIKTVEKKNLNYENLHIGGIGIREDGINVDFIDRRLHDVHELFRKAIDEVSDQIYMDDISIPVVSLEYLAAMKMVSGEPKDDDDLRLLLSIDRLDYNKTRDIVERYLSPITAERLDVFAREAGILPKRGPYKYRYNQ